MVKRETEQYRQVFRQQTKKSPKLYFKQMSLYNAVRHPE